MVCARSLSLSIKNFSWQDNNAAVYFSCLAVLLSVGFGKASIPVDYYVHSFSLGGKVSNKGCIISG